MNSTLVNARLAVAAATVAGLASCGAWAQTCSWPLDPQNEVHTVGNTLEAYWSDSNKRWRFHAGVDLRATPYLDASGAESIGRTLVRAVAAGKVVKVDLKEPSPQNVLVIETPSGERHTYLHLAAVTIPQKVGVIGATVQAGEILGAVDVWPDCGFDHLHFERRDVHLNVLDPLEAMCPRSDSTPPEVEDLVLVSHQEFKRGDQDGTEVPPWGCARLRTGSEVHARIADLGDAGQFGVYDVGVRGLALEVRPAGSGAYRKLEEPSPTEAATKELAENSASTIAVVAGKFQTAGGYCSPKTLWYRFDGDGAPAGALDPDSLGPGIHTVRIRVLDFAGASSERTFQVCVDKSGELCDGAPLIRDCAADDGRLPSSCSESTGKGLSWLVPPGDDGAAVRACVTNRGCDPLDLAPLLVFRFEVKDCGGPTCGSLNEPWEIAVDGLTSDANGLAPGESRCFDVSLPPERRQALSETTAGRLVVRVAIGKGAFAFNGVEFDPAAAAIEIHPPSGDAGPP